MFEVKAESSGGITTLEEAIAQDRYDVEVRNVTHFYGRTKVLDEINLKVRKGEFFSLLGPSGAGKTTLLRIIGGFVFPTRGSVYIQNERMDHRPPYQRNTTMVFQHLALFPHMNVFDNVAYGLKVRRRPWQEIARRVAEVLELVKLTGFENRYPKQLSGGQQQRVALARSIVVEPSVVLFDEPLGSLDLKLRREMEVELKNLQRVLGTTFIYVTHDQEEALTMSDRIGVINEGRLEQVGTVEEIYEKPRTRFVADFIGDTNLIEGKVVSIQDQVATLRAAPLTFVAEARGDFREGYLVCLSVRPEKVRLGEAAEACPVRCQGIVQDIIYTGAKRRYLVRLENGRTLKADVLAGEATAFTVGDEVSVGWQGQDAYLLR